jgi:hypothetical protein
MPPGMFMMRTPREYPPAQLKARAIKYEAFTERYGKSMFDRRRWKLRAIHELLSSDYGDPQAVILALIFTAGFTVFSLEIWKLAALASLHWPFSLYWSRYLLFIGVLLVGVVAHLFKRRNQGLYGAIEVAFGAATAWNVALGIKPSEPMFGRWTALVGCVYFIVRGLSNIQDYRAKRAVTAIVTPSLLPAEMPEEAPGTSLSTGVPSHP